MTLEISGFSEAVVDEAAAVRILTDGYDGSLRRVEDDGTRSVRFDRFGYSCEGYGWQFAGRLYGAEIRGRSPERIV